MTSPFFGKEGDKFVSTVRNLSTYGGEISAITGLYFNRGEMLAVGLFFFAIGNLIYLFENANEASADKLLKSLPNAETKNNRPKLRR